MSWNGRRAIAARAAILAAVSVFPWPGGPISMIGFCGLASLSGWNEKTSSSAPARARIGSSMPSVVALLSMRSARLGGTPWRERASERYSTVSRFLAAGLFEAGSGEPSNSGSAPSRAAVSRTPLPPSPRWVETMIASSPRWSRTIFIASDMVRALKVLRRMGRCYPLRSDRAS